MPGTVLNSLYAFHVPNHPEFWRPLYTHFTAHDTEGLGGFLSQGHKPGVGLVHEG